MLAGEGPYVAKEVFSIVLILFIPTFGFRGEPFSTEAGHESSGVCGGYTGHSLLFSIFPHGTNLIRKLLCFHYVKAPLKSGCLSPAPAGIDPETTTSPAADVACEGFSDILAIHRVAFGQKFCQ